jgi:hypothetical protein
VALEEAGEAVLSALAEKPEESLPAGSG